MKTKHKIPEYAEVYTREKKEPLYKVLAQLVQARLNNIKTGNTDWESKHTKQIEALKEQYFPHGSGFDADTPIDLDRSSTKCLYITVNYHHMNQDGFYTGWTDHTIKVTPDLAMGFDIKVTGLNKNDIKDYIGKLFYECLDRMVERF